MTGSLRVETSPISAARSEDYFERYLRWLDWDSAAEARRLSERRKVGKRKQAEKTGETLLDLKIAGHETGLGGRHLYRFVKRGRKQPLPWNRLRVGAPVVVTPVSGGNAPQNGVVSFRDLAVIQVAVDHWMDGEAFEIDLSPDEVTRDRQRAALAAVCMARGRLAELRAMILGEEEEDDDGERRRPRFGELEPLEPTARTVVNGSGGLTLNASQRSAIQFALSAEDFAVIHGPPGTGKTTSVVEFIRQAVLRGQRVLATAPSNTAVDNLLVRLADTGQNVVRVGHPARVKDDLQEHTLDALVERHANARWVRELYRDAEALFRKADRYTRAKPARGAKQDMRREAKHLKGQARQLQQQTVQEVLDAADVICATTTLDEELLGKRAFDWVVIDEACQATEPACWVPIRRGRRVLLAGDHCQLPPTVISEEAAREGYARSMMERLVERYGSEITRQLDVQYRMHETIMQFSSKHFYDESLVADDSVRRHTLSGLDGVKSGKGIDEAISFVDTAGGDCSEELEPDGASRRNPGEGEIVLRKVDQLIEAGLPGEGIAVIAPYAAQVRWLREHSRHAAVEIDTVDGFQGREKEAVVISLVRSNRKGEIGFLADTRRMNVALTRARRKLIVVGDSATLGGNDFYREMLEYFESHHAYRTLWDEAA